MQSFSSILKCKYKHVLCYISLKDTESSVDDYGVRAPTSLLTFGGSVATLNTLSRSSAAATHHQSNRRWGSSDLDKSNAGTSKSFNQGDSGNLDPHTNSSSDDTYEIRPLLNGK